MRPKPDARGGARENPGKPNPLDLAANQLSFIQRIIDKTLVRQPPAVQTVVLFVFVLLFVYMVIFTTQGSIVLSTKLQVPLSDQQRALAAVPDLGGAPGYTVPGPGFQVFYNDRYYGLNSYGQVRIDLSLPKYLWALSSRKLSITVTTPSGFEYDLPVRLEGFDLEHIALGKQRPGSVLGFLDLPWEAGGLARPSRGLSLVSDAEAGTVSGLRLYVQSVTASNKLDAGEVDATLTVGRVTRPLLSLTSDFGSAVESTLLVKSGASLIQNFQSFFTISQPSAVPLSAGARIKLQAPSGLFTSGTSETYSLPELPLGSPVSVRGSDGGRLVVQLTYPIDVIFFERRDTASTTEALVPRLVEKGYVPRLNTSTARLAGQYNVIYAGDEVPVAAFKEVIGIVSSNGVQLRSIQQVHLKNGVQNQIQVGSSLTVACQDPISQATLRALIRGSDAEFRTNIANLPAPSCT